MNEQQIVEYLRSRGRFEPPVDFTRSVMAAVDEAPAARSWFSAYLPAFVGVGAAAVVAVLALLVGPGRDVGPAPSPSAAPPATSEAATMDELRVALALSVDVLRAAPGVEGRQQAEIDGTIGTATWFRWRPNGDQVVVTRWDVDVTETGWWMEPDGVPPATGQRIYTNIQANVGDEFFFTDEGGDWQVAARDDEHRILAIGPAILDASIVPWDPLMGLDPSFPDASEAEARVEREERSDGGVEWRLESEVVGEPAVQRWTIGPGGELRSWTMEREGRSVDPDGYFIDNATLASLQYTITDGDPIEPPDVDSAPDAAAVGAPSDLALAPPEPLNSVQLSECPPSSAPFRLTLPAGWWTNTAFEHPELGEVPACSYFAPQPFDATASSVPEQVFPAGVAVTMNYVEGGCIGTHLELISSFETTVDGHRAAVSEYTRGANEDDPSGRYEYVVNLAPDVDCETAGRFIVAATDIHMAGEYETNKAILDEMMSTIQIEP